ncbi:hypothetical protein L484_008592 [Morus notabilis]|uniref:Uncharacterized protein n=1 Tax=Morus notabilis TaxID=981085 RepID=W9QJJ9_9ROSA|nr:hypothetical protein L484_008592 [Morus notabilis]
MFVSRDLEWKSLKGTTEKVGLAVRDGGEEGRKDALSVPLPTKLFNRRDWTATTRSLSFRRQDEARWNDFPAKGGQFGFDGGEGRKKRSGFLIFVIY